MLLLLATVAHADPAYEAPPCGPASWVGPADGTVDVPIDARMLVRADGGCPVSLVRLTPAVGAPVELEPQALESGLFAVVPPALLDPSTTYDAAILDDAGGALQQVRFHTGEDLAPLLEAPQVDVVALSVSHRGRSGRGQLADANWTLDVDADPSDPLSVLRVYDDDGQRYLSEAAPFAEPEALSVWTVGPSLPEGAEQCLLVAQENAAGIAVDAARVCAAPTDESWGWQDGPIDHVGCAVAPGAGGGLGLLVALGLVRRKRRA
ncbi:MAG: hypothetical protein R3F59_28760 [Myxococcota bacterium]